MTLGGHRPDPNGFAGAEARRVSGNNRGERLRSSVDQPWGRFLAGLAFKLMVIFALAAAAFWALSAARGY